MELRKFGLVTALALMVIGLCGSLRALAAETPAQEPQLLVSDCAKCHRDVTRDIEEAGGAHKTSVTCLDCHDGHPPLVMEIIPACSLCHVGTPHYGLEQCLNCHKNPHRPREMILSRNLTAPCLTCHEEEGKQLKEFPSYHTSISCTGCHEGRHGNIPNCTDCHKPHSSTMSAADCSRCHQAHKPLAIAFGGDIPSTICAGCHEKAFKELSNSRAKHSKLDCITCHQEKHKMIPACQDCHGTPHPPQILERFNTCGACHNVAHDLMM